MVAHGAHSTTALRHRQMQRLPSPRTALQDVARPQAPTGAPVANEYRTRKGPPPPEGCREVWNGSREGLAVRHLSPRAILRCVEPTGCARLVRRTVPSLSGPRTATGVVSPVPLVACEGCPGVDEGRQFAFSGGFGCRTSAGALGARESLTPGPGLELQSPTHESLALPLSPVCRPSMKVLAAVTGGPGCRAKCLCTSMKVHTPYPAARPPLGPRGREPRQCMHSKTQSGRSGGCGCTHPRPLRD